MSGELTRWDKANISYENYCHYIEGKTERFELTFVDLLYVRNFKGGNASINEEENFANNKLKEYTRHLEAIHQEFGDRKLRELSDEEFELLKKKAYSFVCLTLDSNTSIDGFKGSFASALLHFHFPNLVPILDRRVLNGLGIIRVRKNEQVKDIERYYPQLIGRFYHHLKENPAKSIREYDRENFIKPIRE